MKIEAGKYYRTRDGRKVGPMVINGQNSNLCGCDGSTSTHYSNTGRVRMNGEDNNDLIAEWADAPAVDLTAITTPFGLLDEVYGPGTKEALMAHGGPYEWFMRGAWEEIDAMWSTHMAYRVKPALPKPREWWINCRTGFEVAVLHPTYESADRFRRNGSGDIERGFEADPIHVREVLE